MLGGNDNYVCDLEVQLSASVKKILLDRISFKEAQQPDLGDSLNRKYKPLNAGYKPGSHLKKEHKLIAKNEIPKAPVILYPEEKVENNWKEMRRIGPGLANLGNTCFLNSVLQVLTYTPPLVNYVMSQQHKNKCQCVGFCMQCELTNHMLRIVRHNAQMGGAVRPMAIIQKLQCIGKNFRFGRQEDAHEFLRFVVEAIQKSDYAGKPKLDKLSKETTVANAIFGGYFRSQVKCLTCHYESNTYDPMMDMNLDIKECSNIIQALQKSARPDRLDGDNKYYCDKCRVKRVALKKGTIHKEPNVLTLQLKRFDFSKMFGGKISKDVSFPEDLNIRPFMSCSQAEPILYRLYAVLVHSGYSCNSGHYFCYVRAPNGTWYEMNDNRVSQVGLNTVKNAQAYLLFYVKKESNKNKKQSQTEASVVKQNTTSNSTLTSSNVRLPSNSQTSSLNTNPLGTPVQRKSEPKMVWNATNSPSSENGKTKAESLLKQKAIKLSAYTGLNPKENLTKKALETNKDTGNLSLANKDKSNPTNKESKPETKVDSTLKKEPKLNSLQRLSMSYDTDSPSSSATPSPRSLTSDNEDVNIKKAFDIATTPAKHEDVNQKKAFDNVTSPDKHTKPSLLLNTHHGLSSEPHKMSPIRLKLNHGKYFASTNGKFNVWSPITKGALHPRVIINRSLSENIETEKHKETSNMSSTSESSKIHNTNATTKVHSHLDEVKNHNEPSKVYGPMILPGNRMRNDSITSEAGSVHSQSGDWDIFEKPPPSTPVIPERQHAGWKVSPNSTTNHTEMPDCNDNEDSCNKKKKKNKKKKNKSNSEETKESHVDEYPTIDVNPHHESRKRKHSDNYLLKDKENFFEVTMFNESDDVSNDDHSPKKKKKKNKKNKKHKKEKETSLDGVHSSFLTYSSNNTDLYEESSDKNEKKKKKKKKHKKQHKRKYTSDSDNSMEDGKLQKISLDIKNTLLKYEDSPKVEKENTVNTKYVSDSDSNNKHSKHSKSGKPHPRKSSAHSSRETSPKSKRKHLNHEKSADEKYSTEHKHKKHSSKEHDEICASPEQLPERTYSKHFNPENLSKQKHEKQSSCDHSPEKKSKKHSSREHSPERKHKKHSNVKHSPIRKNNKSSHSHSESSDNDDDHHKDLKEMKNAHKKKDVPCHVWDDEKKKVNTWDGSNTKSNTLEYLLAGGAKVSSWNGTSDNSNAYTVKNREDGETAQDDYDEEYDKGKLKKQKIKSYEMDDESSHNRKAMNVFQDLQDYRNYTKDNTATHRPPVKNHHQRNGKHQFKNRVNHNK